MFPPLVLSLPLLRGRREQDLVLVELIFQSEGYIWKLCESVCACVCPVSHLARELIKLYTSTSFRLLTHLSDIWLLQYVF